jgi:hypothetical protein
MEIKRFIKEANLPAMALKNIETHLIFFKKIMNKFC